MWGAWLLGIGLAVRGVDLPSFMFPDWPCEAHCGGRTAFRRIRASHGVSRPRPHGVAVLIVPGKREVRDAISGELTELVVRSLNGVQWAVRRVTV